MMSDESLERARAILTAELQEEIRWLRKINKWRKRMASEKLPIDDCKCGASNPQIGFDIPNHSYISCDGCGKRTSIQPNTGNGMLNMIAQWNTIAEFYEE